MSDAGRGPGSVRASVVIPAHNEARVIGRLLTGIVGSAGGGCFEVIVVCNGCTDGTEEIAASFGPGVRVLSTDIPSKINALRMGNAATDVFPRIYVDADVEIDREGLLALADAVDGGGYLAASPERMLHLAGSPWLVRSYYAVWSQLPVVSNGLVGRGVVAVSRLGYQRIAALPDVVNDDLYLHLAFEPSERTVVRAACSTVRPPRRVADLLRRRARASMGNAEQAHSRPRGGAAANLRVVAGILRGHPGQVPTVAGFLVVTAGGRLWARAHRRRGGPVTWLRDNSSRA
ncbi:Glycosyl transferase family 2 [Frankia sp. EI5c]|uniref:glycosyltransferase family 2 protein n=1 Tax=Frankia sp. EI5c TaxID=683316 RepID=UPI0007C40A11|nr:glycosyltransferase family 2 protein [Frankia sp. EI5c]OAA25089.1 Glycosyl transferase family 2 [Frankia sp. EI5c]